jgi:transcriptional regulator with XRE-family HTH domain
VQRGVKAGAAIRKYAKLAGMNQADLEMATGIGHSTISGYWSSRLRLGHGNARKIAAVLDVTLEELGLSEEEAADDEAGLRRALAALGETVAVLNDRVTALERERATARSARRARRPKG